MTEQLTEYIVDFGEEGCFDNFFYKATPPRRFSIEQRATGLTETDKRVFEGEVHGFYKVVILDVSTDNDVPTQVAGFIVFENGTKCLFGGTSNTPASKSNINALRRNLTQQTPQKTEEVTKVSNTTLHNVTFGVNYSPFCKDEDCTEGTAQSTIKLTFDANGTLTELDVVDPSDTSLLPGEVKTPTRGPQRPDGEPTWKIIWEEPAPPPTINTWQILITVAGNRLVGYILELSDDKMIQKTGVFAAEGQGPSNGD